MADLKATLTPVQGLSAAVSPAQGLSANLSHNINIRMQTKFVQAGDEPQVIVADAGYIALSQVVVDAVPQGYGKITYNGYILVS